MIHPSYVELMKVVNNNVEIGEEPVVNSRYSIVIAAAKRARQIIDGAEPLIADWNANQQLDFRTVRHAAVFAAAGVGTLWLVLLRHLDRSFCQTNLCAGIEAGGRRLSDA